MTDIFINHAIHENYQRRSRRGTVAQRVTFKATVVGSIFTRGMNCIIFSFTR